MGEDFLMIPRLMLGGRTYGVPPNALGHVRDMVAAAKQCRECHGVPSPNVCPMCTGAGTVALPRGPENVEHYRWYDTPRIEQLVVRAEDRLNGLRNNRYNTYHSD